MSQGRSRDWLKFKNPTAPATVEALEIAGYGQRLCVGFADGASCHGHGAAQALSGLSACARLSPRSPATLKVA